MHRSIFVALAISAASVSPLAWGQQPPPFSSPPLNLALAFEAAWAAQPEAAALAARRDAAQARQEAAQAWTPEPMALALSTRTDQLNRNLGAREVEAGIAVPLWLPGERSRSQALAEAEALALDSGIRAARLRVAGAVREAWWNWHLSGVELNSAQAQLAHALRMAADVAARFKAGDLARADQHQADGAVAAAQSQLAQAEAQALAAGQALRALTTLRLGQADPISAAMQGVEPDPGQAAAEAAGHGELQALQDRLRVAERQAVLAESQSRANPELTLATTRERSATGEPWQQSLSVGLRIPFGGGAAHGARLATARAEQLALQAQLTQERSRWRAEAESAQARAEAARLQLAAAERRAQLAGETRGFFERAFRLGEADLPTRLRIEADAADAERQAGRARIAMAAAVSAWRQALGLLPQ